MKYVVLGAKILLTLAFVAAGASKLIGAESMVAVYETIGVGQWFRYVTGVFEVAGAALLWIKGREAFGAGLLLVTMIGAVIAHLAILGPSFVPALILGLIAGFLLWQHKEQLNVSAN